MSNSVQPIDGSPPGSPVPGTLQARTLESCHFLLQCTKVKRESEVAQSCPTPSDPMDCSLLHPWDLPGKSTGVGCHCLLHRHSMQVDKSEAGQAPSPELSACSAQQQREEHPGMQQIQVHRAGLQAHRAQGELLTDPPACTPRPRNHRQSGVPSRRTWEGHLESLPVHLGASCHCCKMVVSRQKFFYVLCN